MYSFQIVDDDDDGDDDDESSPASEGATRTSSKYNARRRNMDATPPAPEANARFPEGDDDDDLVGLSHSRPLMTDLRPCCKQT